MIEYLVDFANAHPNDEWLELIQEAPYNIKVKESGDYVLLKYDQLNSDMSLPLCQVCRGIIVKRLPEGGWGVVCYPFDKFFNYGEDSAAEIDWSTAVVREKVDGSLIKFWCDAAGWHVSTNGTINAFEAIVDNSVEKISYGDVIERALGCDYKEFCKHLNEGYTYMFELVSPVTQVTVPYNYYALYYLGQRDKVFSYEQFSYNEEWTNFQVYQPKVYNINNIEDCLVLVDEFTKDEEGVVVCDKYFRRIKVKSPEYLLAARAANNGKLGLRTAVRLIQENKVDDFLAYAPMHRVKMDLIIAAYQDIEEDFYNAFYVMKEDFWMPRKNFVYAIQYHFGNPDIFAYLMWQYSNRDYGIKDYMQRLTERKIMDLIKEKIKIEMEEIDDE